MNCDKFVEILRTYGIPFDLESVRAAFDAGESGLREWAEQHLTPDTLLSRDELVQFSALEKSGKAAQLASAADLANVLSFSDQELRDAIQQLRRSTEAIYKQTETLKQQQDALNRLVQSQAKAIERRSALERRHVEKGELDRKALTAAVKSQVQSIDLRISELIEQDKAKQNHVNETINGMLASDDKLLASLQKLGWELDMEDPEEKENVGKLRDLCARLIKCTVETVRTRLDRVYMEALELASKGSSSNEQASAEDVSAVQEELESLYAEILPVAQMSVEQQYLSPALQAFSAKNGKGPSRSARAVEYISECLDYLLDRVESMAARMEEFHMHRLATQQLIAIAKAELAAQIGPASKTERRPTSSSSPTRRRKSSSHGKDVSPIRGGLAARPRRRSSGTGAEESPLNQLFRRLALSVPADNAVSSQSVPVTPAPAKGSGSDFATIGTTSDIAPQQQQHHQIAALAAALADRTNKVADVARNAQESFETTAAAHLRETGLALQIVRDSLLAESAFGRIQLADPEVEASVNVLDQEVDKVRGSVEKAETEIVRAKNRKWTKRDEIIRRWADA
ncbi:hypothetical protein VTK73DRAFT_3203 [Phialemonium thermophilum]|uniref:Uncharacterized protein n=1 Tax=Phialemonium thermophilum TaxID=223376 RepID=A0ABR3X0I0_9PEZI